MSDTPRTDKFEIDYFNEDTSHVDDVFEYARQLERENAALRHDKERLEKALGEFLYLAHNSQGIVGLNFVGEVLPWYKIKAIEEAGQFLNTLTKEQS